MRSKRRSSKSVSDECERKLRSRSATFLVEKPEGSRSPCSSPQLQHTHTAGGKSGRHRGGGAPGGADSGDHRMCQSAGPEVLSEFTSGDHHERVSADSGLENPSLESTQESSFEYTSGELGGGEMTGGEMTGDTGVDMTCSGSMSGSYPVSLSGVSDSGVFNSMSCSDVLDSSLFSTDSEMTSSHALLDSTQDDLDLTPRGQPGGQPGGQGDRTQVRAGEWKHGSGGSGGGCGGSGFQSGLSPHDHCVFTEQHRVTSSSPHVTGDSSDVSAGTCGTCGDWGFLDASREESGMERDFSADSLSGLPRSETVVSKGVSEVVNGSAGVSVSFIVNDANNANNLPIDKLL